MSFPDLPSTLGRTTWTVPGLLQARASIDPESPALWSRDDRAGWRSLSWRQGRDRAAAAARALRALGLRPGDRVGIIAPSSPQWDIAQFAAMGAGAVVIGLDPFDSDERLAQIAAHCGLSGLVAQREDLFERMGDIRRRLRFAVTFEPGSATGLSAFAGLAESVEAGAEADWDQSTPDENALIVFTSGTTGEPKAIAYTHRQVCGAVASILQAFEDIGPGSRMICWLPLSNLFQRMINFCAVGRGAQTYYVADPRTVMQYAPEVAPHLFIGVPRFYEKLYAGIREAIAARPAWQRMLAQWAIAAGERRARAVRAGRTPRGFGAAEAALAERLVLRRIRDVLGGEIRFLISGSAPMPVWLLERLHAMGLPVLEAYGLSESIVPVAANRPQRFRFGTVGQPLAGSEVQIAEDGELLLRGPGVFRGYLDEPVASDRIDDRGYLASGDYARIDAGGFITLLGRKSEVFKTSTGRRIAPAGIESRLRRIPYVEHAVVFGANRPFLTAVLAVAEPALRHRLGGRSIDTNAAATVSADVRQASADLPPHERPGGVVLTTRAFTAAGGLVTTNLKVRRTAVQNAFAAHLEEIYLAAGTSSQAPVCLSRDDGAALLIAI